MLAHRYFAAAAAASPFLAGLLQQIVLAVLL
jgi:hypothetical protein